MTNIEPKGRRVTIGKNMTWEQSLDRARGLITTIRTNNPDITNSRISDLLIHQCQNIAMSNWKLFIHDLHLTLG